MVSVIHYGRISTSYMGLIESNPTPVGMPDWFVFEPKVRIRTTD
ncbi:MAG TPA: hypothetical protein VIX17_05905 [Pyrinomonadaceae bacterium]